MTVESISRAPIAPTTPSRAPSAPTRRQNVHRRDRRRSRVSTRAVTDEGRRENDGRARAALAPGDDGTRAGRARVASVSASTTRERRPPRDVRETVREEGLSTAIAAFAVFAAAATTATYSRLEKRERRMRAVMAKRAAMRRQFEREARERETRAEAAAEAEAAAALERERERARVEAARRAAAVEASHRPPSPPRASTSFAPAPPPIPYYPPGYDDPYAPVPSAARKPRPSERKRDIRKEQRAKYFALVGSKRHGNSPRARDEAIAEFERRCASDDPSDRLFDTARGDAADVAVYGVACRALWEERSLDALAGAGAFSDVFLTHHRTNISTLAFGDGDAVLKCSNPFPGSVNGRSAGEGYHMGSVEARTLASVPQHPAIVRLHAAFLEKSRNESYLLLSAAGDDAHSMRERGALTPRQTRAALRRVLHGVAHCHDHGVVHRDIKAGNVLMTKNDSYRSGYDATLIDFGVAKQAILPDRYSCDVYGTPGYQAPEMLLSDMVGVSHETYAKVDVFAFGVTAFFMCVGRELFGEGEWTSSPNKPEAEAKVKRRAMAFWRKSGRADGDEEEDEDASDGAVLASMLRYADMNMTPAHARWYREMFGDDAAVLDAKTTTTLAEYVAERVSESQPRAFAELIARCLAYDPARRPTANEALAWRDAWRDVVDDADVEEHCRRAGVRDVCFIPASQ